MSSCNATPVKLAIKPIKTVGCMIKESCNAHFAILTLSSLFSIFCAIKESCNGSAALAFDLQYPGLFFRHS